MKYMILAVIISSPAYADNASDICNGFDGVAKTVMEARQEGVSLPSILNVINDTNHVIYDPLRRIALAAYEKPRYNTNHMKIMAISDFRNAVYLDCLRNLDK